MHLQQTTYSVFLPVAVHGRWSGWSPARIDHCSCSGKARQSRTCTNPRPSCGGKSCSGPCIRYVNCDECKCNNGGCEQICKESDEGYSCSCLPGYKPSGSSCIGMWILRLDGCSQVSLAIPSIEKGFVRLWGSYSRKHYGESKQPTEERKGWLNPRRAGLKNWIFTVCMDPLHKWRRNLNNNTWYILSLTFMFQDKGIFT